MHGRMDGRYAEEYEDTGETEPRRRRISNIRTVYLGYLEIGSFRQAFLMLVPAVDRSPGRWVPRGRAGPIPSKPGTRIEIPATSRDLAHRRLSLGRGGVVCHPHPGKLSQRGQDTEAAVQTEISWISNETPFLNCFLVKRFRSFRRPRQR